MRWSDRKKLLALLAGVMCVLLIGGCSTDTAKTRDTSVLRISVGYEPGSLNPVKAFDTVDNIYLNALFEGLTELNEDGIPVPAAAESWEISADQRTYIFHLHPSHWSNGEPVRAQDFVYAWMQLLSPEMGSECAYFLYPVEGAEEYNTGKGSKDQVRIRALDDLTLEVRFPITSGYSNPQFDALVNKAKNTADQGVRMQILHEAEAVVVNDMPALPLSFEKANYLKQPCVKGIVLSGGLVYFKYAWIEP